MAEHKSKIGQTIYFRPKRSSVPVNAPSGRYQITRRLAARDGEFEYATSSDYENHERLARESELILLPMIVRRRLAGADPHFRYPD